MARAEATTSAGRRVSVATMVTVAVLAGVFRPLPSRAETPPTGAKAEAALPTVHDRRQQAPLPSRGGGSRPSLSIGNASVREGDTGTSTLSFRVSMSAASGNDVSVNYATTAGTATPGADYRAASGTLTIRAGQTSGTIRVHVVGDTFLERDEIMYVNLSKPSGAFVSVGQGRGLIRNDDTTVRVSGHFRRGTVHASGTFSPSGAARYLTVFLFRKKNGSFVRIGRHRVSLGGAGDLNGDGISDARFSTSWTHLAHGTYRVKARFAGNSNFGARSAMYLFKG